MPVISASVSASASASASVLRQDTFNSADLGYREKDKDKESWKRSSSRIPEKPRSLGASLWPYVREQVFLGMAASCAPVKTEVADFREELTSAGIRFVYFSPRNMRRSKSAAEKLGIQFDWNCAISLRALDGQEAHDPHRAIRSVKFIVVVIIHQL
jgi:hypothetical protein